MSDIFTGKRILQPKKEIMLYLASKGIRVPHIYGSLDEAIKDMEDSIVMLRSEHPQDYEGSSDLFPNGRLEKELLTTDNITHAILLQDNPNMHHAIEQIHLHCELLGLDYHRFVKDFSHSAWKKIEGTNRVICADSAITGRYHIITVNPNPSYDIINDGKVKNMTDRSYDAIKPAEATGLIEMYEQIREIMDANHCYIIETQTVQNHQANIYDHFALQVHRGIDTTRVDFEAQHKGSAFIRFHNVRGATPTEKGTDLDLTLAYPHEYRYHPKLVVEDASIQASEHKIAKVFSEIMFRKRKLHIFPFQSGSDLRYELSNHCSRNSLFKPECSVLAYAPKIIERFRDSLRKDEFIQVNVNYVSDGNYAYLNLLD